jgi:hypothetical protein
VINRQFPLLSDRHTLDSQHGIFSIAEKIVETIKGMIGERTYEIMKDIKQNQSNMERIVPVTFNPLNRQMLTNAVRFVSDGFLRIHPSFQSLIAQMRAAQHSEGKLIKNQMEGRSFDLIDSMFLALLHYYFSLELQ